jgi:hypothetical protein
MATMSPWRLASAESAAPLPPTPMQPMRSRSLGEVLSSAGPRRPVGRRLAGDLLDDAEVHQLAHAVLDVEPHAAERLHQGFGVESFVGPGAQEAQDAGSQW